MSVRFRQKACETVALSVEHPHPWVEEISSTILRTETEWIHAYKLYEPFYHSFLFFYFFIFLTANKGFIRVPNRIIKKESQSSRMTGGSSLKSVLDLAISL
jgi:hypothetical protein